MAGFRTHITTSSIIGVGYGTAAYFGCDFPWETCALAAGLCGISGMLPDLDSGPGIPLRESTAFAAGVIPMLMIHRFARMGMTAEMISLAGAAIYFSIRYGLAAFLRRHTVHRGMFHSIPACIIAGEIAFLVCSGDDLTLRYFKVGGVMLGFMSHLVLDEIWSVDLSHFRLKSSFGTAIKFWGDCMWANVVTYVMVLALTYGVLQDPIWMGRFDFKGDDEVQQFASSFFGHLRVGTRQRHKDPAKDAAATDSARHTDDAPLR
jgi:hypothetical protein